VEHVSTTESDIPQFFYWSHTSALEWAKEWSSTAKVWGRGLKLFGKPEPQDLSVKRCIC
jgi:hypothetical protein